MGSCRAHAADVLHTVHAILYKGKLVDSRFVSRWEALICYIAAVVHDVEHPGKSFAIKHTLQKAQLSTFACMAAGAVPYY